MFRRQARLRREYIYRKSIEAKERAIQEKKERIKKAIDEGERIPTDLQKEAIELQKQSEWLDEGGEGIVSHVDDEYRWSGVTDPKIVITTSHDPSSKLKQFAKELKILFPNCQRINRGQYEMKKLVDACRANDVTDFILVQEHRGVPDGITICHLPFGPTAYFTLSNVVMRHDVPDVGKMSEQYPHLIFHNFTSQLGKRVVNILKHLFPVPKEDSRRVVTFSVEDDFISILYKIGYGRESRSGRNGMDFTPLHEYQSKEGLSHCTERIIAIVVTILEISKRNVVQRDVQSADQSVFRLFQFEHVQFDDKSDQACKHAGDDDEKAVLNFAGLHENLRAKRLRAVQCAVLLEIFQHEFVEQDVHCTAEHGAEQFLQRRRPIVEDEHLFWRILGQTDHFQIATVVFVKITQVVIVDSVEAVRGVVHDLDNLLPCCHVQGWVGFVGGVHGHGPWFGRTWGRIEQKSGEGKIMATNRLRDEPAPLVQYQFG
ncbi:U3 small nucleolar ribonucleoprotein IMP4 [Trichinella spiralis]|uniref:U3 small nucleolar ribonucleoprotein IMP4 n=1 Tax=Trichinella spiralis TaxID=6334 RepID=A0A0V1BI70_TRISP|nr:U3 small nucleolar ribonucleoprotein IMP4 [Trichinella spiralis]